MGNCQDTSNNKDDKTTLMHQTNQPSSSLKVNEESKRDETPTPVEEIPLIPRFPIIRRPAPQFKAVGYFQGFKEISLSDYKGKYLLLFFFPFDFSQLCHQEIVTYSDKYEEFKKIECDVLGCSMDSQFAHKQYCERSRAEGGLLGLNFPLISDFERKISTNYGVVIEDGDEKGASYRATFIIDKKQVLRHANINDLDANLEVNEILRIVKAFQFADLNGSGIHQLIKCPNSSQKPLQDNNNHEVEIIVSSNLQNNINQIQTPQGQLKAEEPHVVMYARRPSQMGQPPIQRRPSLQQNMLQFHPNLPMDRGTQGGGGGQRKRSILKKRNLFDRMGGEIQIKKFVQKFFNYVKEDSRINYYFVGLKDMEKLQEHFSQFLIQLMGGPQPKAHENLCIDDLQFDAFCEVLEGSLIEHGLDDDAVRELFIFIEPQRDQIVNRDRAKPLLERLGGDQVVQKILDFEFKKIQADKRLTDVLPTLDIGTIKKLQKDFYKVALSSAGYKGKQMRDLHRQLNVHNQQFDIFLDNLNQAIKETQVEGGAGREFLILMEPSLAYKPAKGKENLYSKVGGETAIEKIVTIFFNKVLSDNVLKEFFKNVDINKLRGTLKCFLCFALGGPQKYGGKSLRDAHWHLELQDLQFDTFKALFLETLKDFKIQDDIIKEYEEFLENLRQDVVSVVPPLTTRLGGDQVLEKIVDIFFDRILSDKRVKQFFKSTNTDTLRKFFKNFMIAQLGGINRYTGRSLKEAHQSLNLDDMHFNVIKDHFVEAVKDQKIPLSIVNEVGRVLETFRGEIVVRHSSIHDIIGGDRNLSVVINQTLDKCYKDNSLKMIFKKVEVLKLQEHLKQYMTFLLGGPNNYQGRRLVVAHKQLRISDQQFTIFVQHMMSSFQTLGIDSITIQQINNLLEALRGEIIKRPPTLYERLGGDVAVPDAIVRFCQKLKTDKIICGYFSKSNWQTMTSRLINFFTMITGGPNVYDGPSLKDIHSKINLSGPIFDQFKKLMKDTMFEMGAENNDISEVMNLIETLRTEIIGSKPLSLIDKLGGEAIIKKIVFDFYEAILDHNTLAHFFRKVKMDKMRNNFVDFLMTTLGGLKNRYKGKSLKDAHWKLNLSNQQFNEFKEEFFKVLDDHKIDFELKKDIETFWDSLRPQIVQQEQEDEGSESD